MKSSRVPDWKEVKGSRRVSQQSAAGSITTITQGLVELVTNVDDEYQRMNNPNKKYNGKCLITFDRGEKRDSTLKILDRGRGMDSVKLDSILREHGDKIKSDGADRGFFGRGLLDIHTIANVHIISVKDKKFSTAQISYLTFEYRILDKDVPINRLKNSYADKIPEFELKKIGKLRNGTTIILKIPPDGVRIPQVKSLVNNLRNHYQLRKILCDVKNKEFCNTVDLNLQDNKKNSFNIKYSFPKAELIKNEKIPLEPIKGKVVYANFKLYKTKEPMEESMPEYAHYGILVSGIKAVYENNFLDENLNNETVLRSYYGELQCDYIDQLAREYETKRAKKEKFTSDNPKPIHDQERRKGLTKDHPFIKNHLFVEPIKILNEIVKEHRKEEGDEITDKDDLKFQKKLFDILHDQLKNYQNLNGKGLPYGKWLVIPGGLKIKEGESRSFRVYTNTSEVDLNSTVELSFPEKYNQNIKLKNNKSTLKKNPIREDQSFAEFEIEGLRECNYFDINVNYKKSLRTQIKVSVFIEKNREFKKSLEFEKDNYYVKENSGKSLLIFAKYPDFIDEKKVQLIVSNKNPRAVSSDTKVTLNYVEGTNYLKGQIKVKGLKLQDNSTISVDYEPSSASTIVNVMKDKQDQGTEYKPKYVKHFLGQDIRAAWKPKEENILEITTNHPIVRHYLGSKEKINGAFPGFKTPQWKMFFKEILANAFAEKIVAMNCAQKPDIYERLTSINKSDIKETMGVANKFYQNEVNKFMTLLHSEKVN